MGTKTIPAQNVRVCDRCGRQNTYLETCDICGRESCLVCQGIVLGSMGFTKLCSKCSDRPDVQEVCDRHAKKIRKMFDKRDEDLKKLPKEAPVQDG